MKKEVLAVDRSWILKRRAMIFKESQTINRQYGNGDLTREQKAVLESANNAKINLLNEVFLHEVDLD